MHRLSTHQLPKLLSSEVISGSPDTNIGRGVIVGANEAGQTAFMDVEGQEAGLIDLRTGERSNVVKVASFQDPLTPGLISIDPSGQKILVMLRASMHADPSLVEVDLNQAQTRTVHAFDGPGWLAGAYMPDGITILEQRLGESPVFSIIRKGQTVWTCEGTQPPVFPAAWTKELYLLLVCPNPNPLTGTGPNELCALDIVHGALTPIVEAEGHRIKIGEEDVIIEGDRQSYRVRMTRS